MEFKAWLLTEDNDSIQPFLNWVGSQILAGIQPGQGFIRIRFPDYSRFWATQRPQMPQQASQGVPMALAAHTRLPGPLWGEGLKDEDPEGKGGLAYTATKHMLPRWNAQKVQNFKVGFRKSIAVFGQHFGYLFEVEIFEFLVKKKGLSPVAGELDFLPFTLKESKRKKAELMATISNGVGQELAGQFLQFIQAHAGTVAEQIYQRTVRILKSCRVDSVQFTGGSDWASANLGERADPADLVLSCSSVAGKKRGAVGYSTKFTSEALVNVASMSVGTMYQLMGAEFSPQDKVALEDMVWNFDKTKEYLVKRLVELAEQYENNPQGFVQLLESILTAGHDTFPVARLYIRGSGGGEWSGAFQRDFITTDNREGKLSARPGATVKVSHTDIYVKILYKVDGGSRSGTYIMLYPYMMKPTADTEQEGDQWDMDRPQKKPRVKINIKVNNLATDKFNDNENRYK